MITHRLLAILCGILLIVTGTVAQTPPPLPPPLDTTVPTAILVDARTGNVFFEKNADQLIAPASTSKLMTAILIFDALKAGKLTMDQEFLISEDAWRRGGAPSGGSTMYAALNSRVKLSDLIQGIIVQSANDGCIAVAEGMAGSEQAFAEQMTRRARELGLTKSVFRNSTGLPDPEHLMTARELAILAQYIVKAYPEYYHYYSQPSFTWNKIMQKNRNPLLVDYPGADGMKTGYTKEAGYNLVGSAMRDGRRLVLVVAGAATLEERRREAQKILDWGFKQFRPIEVYSANDRVGRARVWGGETRWVDLVTRKDIWLMLSSVEQQKVTVDLRYDGPLMAPVKPGTKAGTIEFNLDGRTLAEFPLETAAEIGAVNSMWLKAWDSMVYMVFGG
ncbi:D-alanyl-D-alanine carboxypeptidase [Nordella sp. HKS 07]|uniref:D-alanyl-D-alanine carboxypeptidase family protein n=1 Tax=Nordella sp. HKS 07 TaxID=2712222 RepID=UPI0013E11491|nr:D-alanyl-D-alanine carboxypeptidase family protein [Nordella sp. HKS 07]QIG51334.1 D-alanyl-D-alanine carboxypeptidase [Nordella sp. HKS 07]